MLPRALAENRSDSRRQALWAFVFCLLLVALCYANSIPNAFILDDIVIVGANEQIRTIQPLHFFLTPYWGEKINGWVYRPLTILSFSLEYSLWQGWPPGFRMVNLLLHALNGFLIFLLVRGIAGSAPAAWAAAAVYVVHPVHTESVVGIVGRSELLAAFFFFAAWAAFRKGRTWLAAPAYFLGLLAKETAITLPAVLALDMLLAGKSIREVLQSWRRFALLGAGAVVYLGLRLLILGRLGPPAIGQYLKGSLTWDERWITAGRVFIEYLRLMLWPVEVTGDYDFNAVPVAGIRDWDAWLGWMLIAACLTAAVWFARKRPAISLGITFFFVTLLPVSNTVVPIALLMAERFIYTPMFGFALLAGVFWAAIPQRRIRRLSAAGFLSIAAILCIGHNYIWQDKLSFHVNLVRVLPENARGRLGYGFALLNMGKVEDAKVQFEAGLRILPDSAPLMAALAATLLRIDGHCERARPVLSLALVEEPTQGHGLWVLGDCFMHEGQKELAERAYSEAVRVTDFPDSKLLFSWGRALESLDQTSKAIPIYERAAKIDSSNEEAASRLKLLRP